MKFVYGFTFHVLRSRIVSLSRYSRTALRTEAVGLLNGPPPHSDRTRLISRCGAPAGRQQPLDIIIDLCYGSAGGLDLASTHCPGKSRDSASIGTASGNGRFQARLCICTWGFGLKGIQLAERICARCNTARWAG